MDDSDIQFIVNVNEDCQDKKKICQEKHGAENIMDTLAYTCVRMCVYVYMYTCVRTYMCMSALANGGLKAI